jgi:hypothetical protein
MSFCLGFVQGYIKVLGLNLYTFKEPRNRIKGIDSASLCCLARRAGTIAALRRVLYILLLYVCSTNVKINEKRVAGCHQTLYLSYRPARLQRLLRRFLGSLDVYKVTDCHAEVKIEYFIIHQRKFFHNALLFRIEKLQCSH